MQIDMLSFFYIEMDGECIEGWEQRGGRPGEKRREGKLYRMYWDVMNIKKKEIFENNEYKSQIEFRI